MARKEKNIHYIYKTTCNVTGRWYVGMHSTSNENDGYLGSGKRLRHSIRKHGADNHTKEILEYCNSREALVLREVEIVNSELIQDEMCMNLREGGTGGFRDEEHKQKFMEMAKINRLDKLKNDIEFREKFRSILMANTKKAHENGTCKYDNFKGKTHSDESRQLISESMKDKGVGETNSQFGSRWITNDIENKKIKKDDLIPEGWKLGRKIK